MTRHMMHRHWIQYMKEQSRAEQSNAMRQSNADDAYDLTIERFRIVGTPLLASGPADRRLVHHDCRSGPQFCAETASALWLTADDDDGFGDRRIRLWNRGHARK